MYITGGYAYRGIKITTLRCYTNEIELANYIRRCRRRSIEQARHAIKQAQTRLQQLTVPITPELRDRFFDERWIVREREYAQSSFDHATQYLDMLQNGTLEEYITTQHRSTIYWMEDNPVDIGTRQNTKLGHRQLIERFRIANIRLDDRVGDIPLPEDLHGNT